MGYSGVVGTGVSTMISQVRKDTLKSEGKEGELQYIIWKYNFNCQWQKYFPLVSGIYIFGMILFYFCMLLYDSYQVAWDPIFISVIIFVSLLCYLIGIVFTRRFGNRSQKKISQPVAFYAAVSAAEQLENDNIIEASFCADKLLGALSFLVKKKSIKVKSWKSSLKNLLYVKPGDINIKAVHGAIQDSTATKNDFAGQFYALADSLFEDSTSRKKRRHGIRRMWWLDGNISKDWTISEYMVIGDFLKWLSGKSQTYESEMGFWARHQNYKILLEIMTLIAPIILAILMLINTYVNS